MEIFLCYSISPKHRRVMNSLLQTAARRGGGGGLNMVTCRRVGLDLGTGCRQKSSYRAELIGPPHPVTNLRPIKFARNLNETKSEAGFALCY